MILYIGIRLTSIPKYIILCFTIVKSKNFIIFDCPLKIMKHKIKLNNDKNKNRLVSSFIQNITYKLIQLNTPNS